MQSIASNGAARRKDSNVLDRLPCRVYTSDMHVPIDRADQCVYPDVRSYDGMCERTI